MPTETKLILFFIFRFHIVHLVQFGLGQRMKQRKDTGKIQTAKHLHFLNGMEGIFSALRNQITKAGKNIVALQSGTDVLVGMMSRVALQKWTVTRANMVNETSKYFQKCFKLRFHIIFLDDECAKHSDNCDTNAKCTDTIFSFSCECNIGYEGNGVDCEGTFKLF